VLSGFLHNARQSLARIAAAMQAPASLGRVDTPPRSPRTGEAPPRPPSGGAAEAERAVGEDLLGLEGAVVPGPRGALAPARAPDAPLKGWRETVRFEARSVSSAASTLGAVQVSDRAVAVENGCLEGQPASQLQQAVAELVRELDALAEFVRNDFGAKPQGALDKGGAEEDARAGSASGAQQGGEQALVGEMLSDTLFAS
jgi:HPt (histidine-containing phosphotransfer) domain-containing protein